MAPLDIAICGCGPAGLAAALLLTEAGHHVRLIEQFTEPKPLGSGLLMQPTGLAVLDRLGVGDRLRRLGQPIDRLYGRAVPSGRIVLDIRYDALGAGAFSDEVDPGSSQKMRPRQESRAAVRYGRIGTCSGAHAYAVHRGALFNVLFDAVVARRIPIEAGFRVARCEASGGTRPRVIGESGRALGPFDLVIDALGARSAIAHSLFGAAVGRPLAYGALWATVPWVGAPFASSHLEQRYQRASVMVGVLPVGRRREDAPAEMTFFWSLQPVLYEQWRRRGLARWRDDVRAIWPETEAVLTQINEPDQLALAAYGHHTLRTPYQGPLAFIGDTAHATSPQLGQGGNMGLLDALALASALSREAELGDALAAYAAMRRWHVRLYQTLSALFTPFYQSDSRVLPILRDRLFQTASGLPGVPRLLANLVAGTLGDPLGRIERQAPLPATFGERA